MVTHFTIFPLDFTVEINPEGFPRLSGSVLSSLPHHLNYHTIHYL